jgi:hypothetical protein
MNKFINAIPLVVLGILVAYFSFTEAQPGALLPKNKSETTNPDMPENLNAVGYIKKKNNTEWNIVN